MRLLKLLRFFSFRSYRCVIHQRSTRQTTKRVTVFRVKSVQSPLLCQRSWPWAPQRIKCAWWASEESSAGKTHVVNDSALAAGEHSVHWECTWMYMNVRLCTLKKQTVSDNFKAKSLVLWNGNSRFISSRDSPDSQQHTHLWNCFRNLFSTKSNLKLSELFRFRTTHTVSTEPTSTMPKNEVNFK